jgi:ADP-ribose pyrophosphatase YjhB (NUDIX family)
MISKQRVAGWMRRFPWLYPLLVRLVKLVAARFTVGVNGVVFNSQGEILLLKHVFRGRYPWGLPGGWVRRREQPRDALQREMLEEIGLPIRVVAAVRVELNAPLGHLDTSFLCEAAGDVDHLSSEILDWRWFPPDALPPDVKPLELETIDCALAHRRQMGMGLQRRDGLDGEL